LLSEEERKSRDKLMPIHETFSKRQQRLASEGTPILYQYIDLPYEFRVKVIHIWRGALDFYTPNPFGGIPTRKPELVRLVWNTIHNTLTRERGLFDLEPRSGEYAAKCETYLLNADTGDALDIIELTFQVIDQDVRQLSSSANQSVIVDQPPDDAIEELNHRFGEYSIGYQFSGGQLLRVDSQYLHSQVVEPVLALLHEQGFEGPEDEFLSGQEYFRGGKNKEAIADALKSLESTMKAICDKHQWPYSPNDTAKSLLDVLFTRGIIPSYLQTHFTSMRTTLESGLPTVRNKTSGHGQGANPVAVPDHLAAYALHLAAANIVFLVQAHKALS
jgi:hypothetical protein